MPPFGLGLCLCELVRLGVFQQAGGCPAATHFSLSRQRKVSKRKATLLSASLRFAAGNLRCSVQPGPGSNSPSAQTIARPDPSGPALLGAYRREVGSGSDSGSGSGEDAQSASSPPRIGIGFQYSFPHPSGWAEERSRKWIRASDCLSRRRVRARPHFRRAPQVAPERSAGDPDHRVAFSLLTFFWRSKRK